MGRSAMQGTAWHYEYLKSTERNSKNCAYNTGCCCSCTGSCFYHKECVGEKRCEMFDRSSFRVPTQKKAQRNVMAPKNNKVVKHDNTVKATTAKVKAESLQSHIVMVFRVANAKSPFVGKRINDVVSLNGGRYRIVSTI